MKQLYLPLILLNITLTTFSQTSLNNKNLKIKKNNTELESYNSTEKVTELESLKIEYQKLEVKVQELSSMLESMTQKNKLLSQEVDNLNNNKTTEFENLKIEHQKLKTKIQELSSILESITQENQLLSQEVYDLNNDLKNNNNWDVFKILTDFKRKNYGRGVTKGYMLMASTVLPVIIYYHNFKTQ